MEQTDIVSYQNPIIPGFFPDPSIVRVNKDYFVVSSSFDFVPGIPLHHSTDLINWKFIGHVLTRESQLPLPKQLIATTGGIYAPCIRYHNGVYYVICTNGVRNRTVPPRDPPGGMFICSTTDPFIRGSWSEPIWVDMTGIDPDLFFDDDGEVYVCSTKVPEEQPEDYTFPPDGIWGIQQAKIDVKSGELLSEPKMIYTGTGGKWPEGPHIYKVNGMYYLLLAEGGTEYGHMVTIAQGDNPSGPWTPCPRNPILSNRSLRSPLQGTGHADFVETDSGDWFVVFHGFRPQGYPMGHILGRETCLAPFVWIDGWPFIGTPTTIGRVSLKYTTKLPSPATTVLGSTARVYSKEKFGTNNELSPIWSSLGHMPKHFIECEANLLKLVGTEVGLSEGSGCSFVGRRQQHIRSGVSVLVQSSAEEAGLSIFANSTFHYDIIITQKGVVLRRKVGTMEMESNIAHVEAEGLWVNHENGWYSLGYIVKGEEVEVGKGEAHFMATEVAGGFAGILFGCYVKGGVAEFRDFVYTYTD